MRSPVRLIQYIVANDISFSILPSPGACFSTGGNLLMAARVGHYKSHIWTFTTPPEELGNVSKGKMEAGSSSRILGNHCQGLMFA